MKEEIIKKIIREAFHLAKQNCSKSSTNALSIFIAEEIQNKSNERLSYKTIERLHNGYLTDKIPKKNPEENTIKLICNFLGYDSYQNYINSQDSSKEINLKAITSVKFQKELKEAGNSGRLKPNLKAYLVAIIGVLLLMLVLMYSIGKNVFHIGQDVNVIKQLKISELPNYLENRHDVWQATLTSGDKEYFDAPGKHPITGQKLALVSESELTTIVEKIRLENSEVESQNKSNSKKESVIASPLNRSIRKGQMTILIFDNGFQLDNKMISGLQDNVFASYKTGNISNIGSLSKNTVNSLLAGNISILKDKVNSEYICVGTIKKSFRNGDINSDIIICDLKLKYNVYNRAGIRQGSLSKSKVYTGQGFTKLQAETNTIKKVK